MPQGGKVKDLRDLSLLQTKITTGMTNDQLAAQFGISERSVARGLKSAADRADLIAKFEDELLADLVPEAVKAVKEACKNGNANVALEILKGAGILKKPRDMNRTAEGGEGDSLELFLKLKKQRTNPQPPPAGQPVVQADPPSSVPRYELPATAGDNQGDSPQGAPAALPSGSGGWLSDLTRLVDDGALAVVEGEVLRTDSESMDGEVTDGDE